MDRPESGSPVDTAHLMQYLPTAEDRAWGLFALGIGSGTVVLGQEARPAVYAALPKGDCHFHWIESGGDTMEHRSRKR